MSYSPFSSSLDTFEEYHEAPVSESPTSVRSSPTGVVRAIRRTSLHEKAVLEIFASRPHRNSEGVFFPSTAASKDLAKKFHIADKTVRDIWNRRSWSKVTRPHFNDAEVKAEEEKTHGMNGSGILVIAAKTRAPGRPRGATDTVLRKRKGCESNADVSSNLDVRLPSDHHAPEKTHDNSANSANKKAKLAKTRHQECEPLMENTEPAQEDCAARASTVAWGAHEEKEAQYAVMTTSDFTYLEEEPEPDSAASQATWAALESIFEEVEEQHDLCNGREYDPFNRDWERMLQRLDLQTMVDAARVDQNH